MKNRLKEIYWTLNYKIKWKYLSLTDFFDLMTSKSINIDQCKTVGIILGPYRNLTTLTAATLFLHPHCQVLNHAGLRIYKKKEIDFFSDFSKKNLDRFIQFAIKISQGGFSGHLGGTMLKSHVFLSQGELKKSYIKKQKGLTKKRIFSLVWKEPLRTSRHIRDNKIDLDQLVRSDKRLRFLMPVRNPMDCALSNTKTGHVRMFKGLMRESSIFDCLDAVLDEILWFVRYQEKYPDHFFYFFEHNISKETFITLAKFLNLDPNQNWLQDALRTMQVKSKYQHDKNVVDFYEKSVIDKFLDFPAISHDLLKFL